MPQIPTNFDFLPQDPLPVAGRVSSPSTLTRFARTILRSWQLMASVVNGQISFGNGTTVDNISGVWVLVTFAAANTDQLVTHNLGRIPVGYLLMTKSASCDVYTGSVGATKTQITLRGTTTSTVNLFIL